jgi:hypothetical protein
VAHAKRPCRRSFGQRIIGSATGRQVGAWDGGSRPVEMAAGVLLILISLGLIVFIIRTVQANLAR